MLDEPSDSRNKEDTKDVETASTPRFIDESVDPKTGKKGERSQTTTKESYDDYIKSLPPPFWETKRPPPSSETGRPPPRSRQQDRSAEEIAASINAVCAPITAEDREEDAKRSSRTLRERWKDWRSDRDKRKSEVDIRPMEKGSSARLNVFGANLTDKRKR